MDSETKPKIMVVDDMLANLHLLEGYLENQGYALQLFTSGRSLLDAAAQEPPDLILLDIMMPEMDGFAVCRALKSMHGCRDIPVIFISALEEVESKVKGFLEGGVDYITKPFQREEVLVRVQTHLMLRAQLQQIAAQKREAQACCARLQHLETLRDQMVHMVVHDMRSPLQAIIGYADLFHDIVKDPEEKDMANQLQAASHRLSKMLAMMLDISRMEDDQMTVHQQNCDLRNLLDETIAFFTARESSATIIRELGDAPVWAYCDLDLTRRVIENLITNALKFSGAEGLIRIKLTPYDQWVRLEFTDNGPGIPDAYKHKIFEKFCQIDKSSLGRQQGAGLGLTFCKLAMEAQGGKIDVHSVRNEGSTFWIDLPAGSKH